jgi:hypothetical protein
MGKIRLYGALRDYDACVALMDDEIREQLHDEMAGACTEQEFLDEYVERHLAKFGERFEV